jgi:hypothetical protein
MGWVQRFGKAMVRLLYSDRKPLSACDVGKHLTFWLNLLAQSPAQACQSSSRDSAQIKTNRRGMVRAGNPHRLKE